MGWPFAVWLCPAEPARTQLQACIVSLCGRHQAPLFTAHMTLFSGHYERLSALRAAFHTAAAELGPVTVDVLGLATGEQFFRTLYLRLDQPPELTQAHDHLRAGLDPDSRYELRPHLSLIYKRTDEPAREQLRTDVQLGLTQIAFDSLVLAAPAEGHEDWTDIANWRILERVWMHQITPMV